MIIILVSFILTVVYSYFHVVYPYRVIKVWMRKNNIEGEIDKLHFFNVLKIDGLSARQIYEIIDEDKPRARIKVLYGSRFIGTLSTIGSNSMGLLLSGYPTMAGTASSLAGTLRFGTGSIVGAIVAFMPGGVTWPMVTTMTACSILSAALYWIFGRKA